MKVALAPEDTKSIIRLLCTHLTTTHQTRYQERHLMWRPRIRRVKRARTLTKRRASCYLGDLSYKCSRLLIVG